MPGIWRQPPQPQQTNRHIPIVSGITAYVRNLPTAGAVLVGLLISTLKRNFIFSRAISAAKIGLLYKSINKVISKTAITTAKIGLLFKTLSKVAIYVILRSSKIGLLSSISRIIKEIRNLLPKLGLVSIISRLPVKLEKLTALLGIKVLSSSRKTVIYRLVPLTKLGLLTVLRRLQVNLEKLTSLLGIKTLSITRKLVFARLISPKIGILPKAIRGFIKNITAKLGIVIPKVGPLVVQSLTASIGLLQKGIIRIPVLARKLAPKIGLLATRLSQSIRRRVLSGKDGLIAFVIKGAVKRIIVSVGLLIKKLSFKTLVWVFIVKLGDAVKSLSKQVVFRRIISPLLGVLVYKFYKGNLNQVVLTTLLGLQGVIKRVGKWARKVVAREGLLVTYFSKAIIKLFISFLGVFSSLWRNFYLSKRFSSSIGLLTKIAQKRIKEIILSIKLGLKSVIIRLGVHKEILKALLGTISIFTYIRKIFGYRILKFIKIAYQLLFKEEEDIK